jgi:hypothetical protein
MMCLWAGYKEKYEEKKFSASLKSMKKGVRSGVGSGSISQRYGSIPKCHGSPTLRSIYIDEFSSYRKICCLSIAGRANGSPFLTSFTIIVIRYRTTVDRFLKGPTSEITVSENLKMIVVPVRYWS